MRVATLVAALLASGPAPVLAPSTPPYLDSNGRALMVVPDADMVASAYVSTRAATLMSIRFDAAGSAGAPAHVVMTSAAIGGSPENFAIS